MTTRIARHQKERHRAQEKRRWKLKDGGLAEQKVHSAQNVPAAQMRKGKRFSDATLRGTSNRRGDLCNAEMTPRLVPSAKRPGFLNDGSCILTCSDERIRSAFLTSAGK